MIKKISFLSELYWDQDIFWQNETKCPTDFESEFYRSC